MAAADIYAMPSLAEPFGLVFLEAMAMELPVFALNSGGRPRSCRAGHDRLTFPNQAICQVNRTLACLDSRPTTPSTHGSQRSTTGGATLHDAPNGERHGTVYQQLNVRGAMAPTF